MVVVIPDNRGSGRNSQTKSHEFAHSFYQPPHVRIIYAHLGQMRGGVEQIFRVGAAPANGTGDHLGLRLQIELAVLLMLAGDHIGQRLDRAPVFQSKGYVLFHISRRNQLAVAQIGQNAILLGLCHAERHTGATGLRLIKGQNQPGFLYGATVMDRQHTKTAVIAVQGARHRLSRLKPRIPQQ